MQISKYHSTCVNIDNEKIYNEIIKNNIHNKLIQKENVKEWCVNLELKKKPGGTGKTKLHMDQYRKK